LVDRVDRFPFTRTATKNEDAGDQLELGVFGCAMAMNFTVFPLDEFGNSGRLTAVTAKDTAEM